MSLQTGDSVIVNDGVKESDESDVDISRWQGRIIRILDEVDDEIPMVQIQWDSLTLKQMPKDYIAESEKEGIDWQYMDLPQSDLKKTQPRDTISDVRVVQDKIYDMYVLGDAAERVAKILGDADSIVVSEESLERWLEQFRSTVRLPLPVVIEDNDRILKLKKGGIARITAFEVVDDIYGIIVKMVYNTQKFDFPLCNLKAMSADAPAAQLIEDYKDWFANL